MHILLSLVILLFSSSVSFSAVPCYEQAKIPAHEFPFLDASSISEVTSLSFDGTQCETIKLWNGEPILASKMYAPYRAVYEAYAKGIEKGDIVALRKTVAYLRPTPRNFSKWLWIYETKEGALMPWGMPMAIKIVRFLQPYDNFIDYFMTRNEYDIPILDMPNMWPTLFLLMNGELYPDNKWVQSTKWQSKVGKAITWRYPQYTVFDKKGEDKEKFLKLQ